MTTFAIDSEFGPFRFELLFRIAVMKRDLTPVTILAVTSRPMPKNRSRWILAFPNRQLLIDFSPFYLSLTKPFFARNAVVKWEHHVPPIGQVGEICLGRPAIDSAASNDRNNRDPNGFSAAFCDRE